MAYSLSYINDFKGPCILQIRQNSIVIKKSNGSVIGTWLYRLIREFRFDDENKTFQFTSGRRGPFGLANYMFDLHDRIYDSIRETVNRIARGGGELESVADGGGGMHASGVRYLHADSGVGGGGVDGSGGGMPNGLDSIVSGECIGSGESNAPPVPPHGRWSKFSNGHHVEMSHTRHRSVSIPDLRKRLPPARLNSSRKCSLSETSSICSQRDRSISSSSSISEESSESEYSEVCSVDYQIPRNATVCVYDTPRLHTDPVHDYQVPNPIDKTYMVPRRGGWSRVPKPMDKQGKLEHFYEDPDMFTV